MFSVYGLTCNGLREPLGVTGGICLSWRLGSDRVGAYQKSFRVVVVSLSTGDVVWDTGDVLSRATSVRYQGPALEAGTYCSWFVTVVDDAGEEALSIPNAFCWGSAGDVATSELGPERASFVWTSDETANAELEFDESLSETSPWWTDVLGVSLEHSLVRIAPHLPAGLLFVQGSLLLSEGLLLVRVERMAEGLRMELTLPPGLSGEIHVGDVSASVGSGHHVIAA